jgi:cobalamin biosynthesis protein CobT
MTYKIFTEDFDRTLAARAVPVIEAAGDYDPLSDRVWRDAAVYLDRNFAVQPDWVEALGAAVTASLSRDGLDGSEVAVCLLMENSARLRGGLGLEIMQLADLTAQALEACGIALDLLGYTTGRRAPGLAHAQWLRQGQPDEPGRIGDVLHIEYKTPGQSWREARDSLPLMAREDVKMGNVDGEAIRWAAARLARRPGRRRVLVVVNHGSPRSDDAGPYARRLLFEDYRRAVNDARAAGLTVGQLKLGTGGMDAHFSARLPLPRSNDRRHTLEAAHRDVFTRELADLLVPAAQA